MTSTLQDPITQPLAQCQCEVSMVQGVIRIIAATRQAIRQSAVVRYGIGGRRIVVDLTDGSADSCSYTFSREDVQRIELHCSSNQFQFVNDTSLAATLIA